MEKNKKQKSNTKHKTKSRHHRGAVSYVHVCVCVMVFVCWLVWDKLVYKPHPWSLCVCIHFDIGKKKKHPPGIFSYHVLVNISWGGGGAKGGRPASKLESGGGGGRRRRRTVLGHFILTSHPLASIQLLIKQVWSPVK